MLQSIASSQPTIVSSGSLILDNGLPALQAIPNNLMEALFSFDITLSAAFSVFNLDTADFFEVVMRTLHVSADTYFIRRKEASNTLEYRSPTFFGTASPNSQILSSYFTTSTGNSAFVNGVSDGSKSGAFNGANRSRIRLLGTSGSLNGKFQELIMYLNNQTANRAIIEGDINSHYSIF